jgi:hypothetical protein
MSDGLGDVRLEPALIAGRVHQESGWSLLLWRLGAAVIAGYLVGWMVDSVITSNVGSRAGAWAGWLSFAVVGLVVFWRCDARAVVRYLPELTGRRPRARWDIPVRHDHVPLREVRPGQWIAPRSSYQQEVNRLEARARQRAEQQRLDAQRYSGKDAGNDEVVNSVSVSIQRPSTLYRQVLVLTRAHDGDTIVISFVGGDTQSHPAIERFYLGRWRGHQRRGSATQAQAVGALMAVLPLRDCIGETSLLAQLSAEGHDEADLWHALRALLQVGMVTRVRPVRRLPREIHRMFAGPGTRRPYPPREIELTVSGRAWAQASPLLWQRELPQMLVVIGGYLRIDFTATDAAATLHADLAAITSQLSALSRSVNGLTEELTLVRNLLNGQQVPREQAGAALNKFTKAAGDVLTNTIAGVLAEIVIRMAGI